MAQQEDIEHLKTITDEEFLGLSKAAQMRLISGALCAIHSDRKRAAIDRVADLVRSESGIKIAA